MGFKPMTPSILGRSCANWATKAAIKLETFLKKWVSTWPIWHGKSPTKVKVGVSKMYRTTWHKNTVTHHNGQCFYYTMRSRALFPILVTSPCYIYSMERHTVRVHVAFNLYTCTCTCIYMSLSKWGAIVSCNYCTHTLYVRYNRTLSLLNGLLA